MVPIVAYLLFDLTNFITALRINASGTEGEVLHVNNSRTISSLAHIDYVVSDLTGTLTQAQYELDTVFVNKKLFNIDVVRLRDEMKRQRMKLENSLIRIPKPASAGAHLTTLLNGNNNSGNLKDPSRAMISKNGD
jgi:magnesium-transporting ATPase (P-type)